jgi:signal transduction histidine kinase
VVELLNELAELERRVGRTTGQNALVLKEPKRRKHLSQSERLEAQKRSVATELPCWEPANSGAGLALNCGAVPEENPKPPLPISEDRRNADRRATDARLQEERQSTDDLLGNKAEARVIKIVRERRGDVERRLKSARRRTAEVDQTAVLPEVSNRLEDVAESLTKAADSLNGVADSLKESVPERRSIDIVDDMAQVAEQVADTAERLGESTPPVATPDTGDAPGELVEQLGAIAEGMAEVTATIADERRDEDDRLERERQVTDRVVEQEITEIGAGLVEQLRHERELLRKERAATDTTLTIERRNTDEAVDHVLDLLAHGTQARVEAERTVATRSELLHIVSHDLRGPLMTIGGVASLMAGQAREGQDGERLAGWAAMIKRSVSVMERLIHDLLDFGSFENGQLRVITAPHDIGGVVAHAVEAFESVAAAKHVALSADLPDDAVVALCDHHRIFQVLANLIHNAIKFTPKGGSICVRVRVRETECLVSVTDTGIGIPKHELQSIFEQFLQLDASDRRGLGLGLYISLLIVESHGGRIWADSEVGAGTTISFTLPREI